MALYSPMLGRDRPHCDSKSGIRNLYFDSMHKVFVCQATIGGKHRHIARFRDKEKAIKFVKKMHEYDLNDEKQLELFIRWANDNKEKEQ